MPEPNGDSTDGDILAERHHGVLLLTFNRPDQLNAWTPAMQTRYFDLLEEADHDQRVRVILITGAGRAFCAGSDLCARSDGDPDSRPLSLPISLRKPIVSAINGPVSGIGLANALFTDVRFAAQDASFTTAFSKRGLLAEHGVAWLLPKLVGLSTAMDLLLSARSFAGTEALSLGLVDRAVPADQVRDAAMQYARSLANDCSPAAMAGIKQQIYTGLDSSLEIAKAGSTDHMIFALHRESGGHERSERRAPRFPPLDG